MQLSAKASGAGSVTPPPAPDGAPETTTVPPTAAPVER